MAWSEALICRAIQRQLLQSKCIVLVPNCNWAGHEGDLLGVTMDGRLIDVEVKISRADFKADADKDKWWRSLDYGTIVEGRWTAPMRQRVEWPRRVWKHYYCMPAAIFNDSLLEFAGSPRSGVLTIAEQRAGGASYVIRCVRRAQPNKQADRLTPTQCLDVARLANLRMWDALAAADRHAAREAA